MWDLNANKQTQIAGVLFASLIIQDNALAYSHQHNEAISFVHWIGEKNILMTGSWDGTLKSSSLFSEFKIELTSRYWDGRQQQPALSADIKGKLYSADVRKLSVCLDRK